MSGSCVQSRSWRPSARPFRHRYDDIALAMTLIAETACHTDFMPRMTILSHLPETVAIQGRTDPLAHAESRPPLVNRSQSPRRSTCRSDRLLVPHLSCASADALR